jgi:hypothetical protein
MRKKAEEFSEEFAGGARKRRDGIIQKNGERQARGRSRLQRESAK